VKAEGFFHCQILSSEIPNHSQKNLRNCSTLLNKSGTADKRKYCSTQLFCSSFLDEYQKTSTFSCIIIKKGA